MNKKYKCGLYIGRFQPIHIGHESIIHQMLKECDQVIIAIGSAQESGTERNPFNFYQRADLGTFLSNDTYADPLNIVIKLQYVNGHPVAKISDTIGKAMCQDKEYLDYLEGAVAYRLKEGV